MAQNVLVGATQQNVSFPAGTQAVGFHRFTLQLQPAGPVVTHLEPIDSTPSENPAAGTYELTYATIGVDGVTVLGPIQSVPVAVGASVVLAVAAGITVQVAPAP